MLRLAWVLAAVLATGWAGAAPAQVQIDVNRPRTPFDCKTPLGRQWYGSTNRCLEELCAGGNVTNEYLFDQHNRRRENPCYGRNPFEFEAD